MEKWKRQLKESLESKRQIDLDILFGEMEEFPGISKDDNIENYMKQLHSFVYNKRLVYLESFTEETPLKGKLEDYPQKNIKFILEAWDIQRKVNHCFLEKFDENVESFWNRKISQI